MHDDASPALLFTDLKSSHRLVNIQASYSQKDDSASVRLVVVVVRGETAFDDAMSSDCIWSWHG